MPGNSKLGSGLDAIFGSDINSLLDDIQNGTEPISSLTLISQEKSLMKRNLRSLLIPLRSMVYSLLY